MGRVVACVVFVGILFLAGGAHAEPEVSESAVEEIMPGVFIRDRSGVSIDLGDRRCNPPCGEGQSCESVCEETACNPGEGPLARCSACAWECQ